MSKNADKELDDWMKGLAKLKSLKFCNCGNPEEGYAALRDTLAAYDNDEAVGGWEGRCERTDKWWKERGDGYAHLLLYFIDTAGLLEHGGSVGGSWLSEEGKLVLAFLRQWGVDPDGWIDEEGDVWT